MQDLVGKKVCIPAGRGYWDLSLYPWGGDFKRLEKDTVAVVARQVGDKIVVDLDGKPAGFNLDTSIKIVE